MKRRPPVLAGLVLVLVVAANGCLCESAGRVCAVTVANTSFEDLIAHPSAALVQWIQQHYSRMLVYTPAFDAKLAWYPRGWAYKNTYAIYPGSRLATQHPDWILRDASGQALYIPWACAGGVCPQYAGDVGNPAFRASWIADAAATLAAGYTGLFLDDFNMRLQMGDGSGRLVPPVNPRTGGTMTDDEWRGYLADFATEVRRAFPRAEIVENQVYFFASPADPNVIRATSRATHVWIERGFNDSGIVGGKGRFGFETLLAFVDAVHRLQVGTVEEIQTSSGREYALACYFLTSTGADGLVNPTTHWPTNWWDANDVDLGTPAVAGHYRTSDGLFRRNFSGGRILVNQPGSPTVTVALEGTWARLDGTPVTQVTIGPADGVVLTKPRPSGS